MVLLEASATDRRRRLALVALPLAAAAILAVLVAVSRSDAPTPIGRVRNTTTSSPPTSAAATTSAVATTIGAVPVVQPPPVQPIESAGGTATPLRPQPSFLSAAGDRLFLQYGLDTGEMLDATTGDVVGPLDFETDRDAIGLSRPVVAFGSVWFRSAGHEVVRVDAVTGAVQQRIVIQDRPLGGFWSPDLAVGSTGIWTLTVATATPQELIMIDPTSGEVTTRKQLPEGALTLAYAFDSIWLTSGSSTITRLNASTLEPEATVVLPVSAEYVVAGADSMWFTGNQTAVNGLGALARLDPRTNAVAADIVVTGRFTQPFQYDIAVGGGYVWLNTPAALLVQVDMATNAVVARFGGDVQGGALATDGETVWVVENDDTPVLHRLPVRSRR